MICLAISAVRSIRSKAANEYGKYIVLPLSSVIVVFRLGACAKNMRDVGVPVYERMSILMKIAQSEKYTLFFCCTSRVSL